MAEAAFSICFIILLVAWRRSAYWARKYEREYSELFCQHRDDCIEFDEKIKNLELSRDHYAELRNAALKTQNEMTKVISSYQSDLKKLQKERDFLASLNEKFKSDADAETEHCRTLEKQVAAMQQELDDVHAKATDLIERLDAAKKACEHPYGGRFSANAE